MTNANFDIDDIKFKLKFISDATDYDAFYNFLISIIKPNDAYLNKIFVIRNNFKKQYHDFEKDILTYNYWSANRARIDLGLLEILDELESECLKEDSESLLEDFINRYNIQPDGDVAEVVEPIETFFFPESTQDIIIPDTKELTDAERQQYKRLLMQCQDAIGIQAYQDAFKFCDTARKEIEPESAQLYEYLLLTYIKKESLEKIVEETLKGNTAQFDQVLLYTQRCKKYQNVPKPKCPSKTLDANLEKIAKDFALCLRTAYKRIKSDWVIYTEGGTFLQDKQRVQTMMEVFEKIYTQIYKTDVFFTEIYFEICGAGKFQWIKLDKNNKPYDATMTFKSLYKKGLIEKILKESFTKDFKRTEKTPENVFAVKTYYALWSKYMNLKDKIKHKSQRFGNFTTDYEARQQMIRCFDAFKTAYCLFKDKRFLEIPIKELTHGLFTWFDIGENGSRVNKSYFDAETEYKYYTTEKGNKVFTAKMDDTIEKHSAYELTQKTTNIYNEIYRKGSYNHSIYERERHNIYLCLYDWFKSYCAVIQPIVIDSIMNEITGRQSLLTWFDSTPTGFVSKTWRYTHPDNIFSIDTFLREMLTSSIDNTIETYNLNNIREEIAKRFYGDLKNRYENESVDYQQLKNALKDLEIVLNCYLWHKNIDYLNFAVNEIWVSRLWHWLILDANGQLGVTYEGQKNGFEPYTYIAIFCNKIEDKISQTRMIELIADKFFADAFHQYNNIYPSENPIDRENVIHFIRSCKRCFFLFQKTAYLESAIKELKGLNKFKWINNFPIIGPVNVSSGKINGFDAIKALKELSGIVERSR